MMSALMSKMRAALVTTVGVCAAAASGATPADLAGVGTPVDWTIAVLLALGILLLLLELKIVSQGILAFLGSVSLAVAAGLLLWQDRPFFGVPIWWIMPVIVLIIALAGLLGWLAVQAQKERVASGYEGFVGEIGEAAEALNPEGRVLFQGSYWRAVSETPVAAGERVRVVAADRLKLLVEPLEKL